MRLLLLGAFAIASFGCDRLFGLEGVVLDGDTTAMCGTPMRGAMMDPTRRNPTP